MTVDHYQLLDYAAVVDGVVYADGNAFPYKSLINFNDPNEDIVFVPSSLDGQPTSADIEEIGTLNAQIIQQGGVLDEAP